jgi:hypothetical protein
MSLLKNALASVFASSQRSGERATIVTSMHARGYEDYGKRFIDTFEEFWPRNYELWVYAEGFEFEPASSRTRSIDLLASSPDLVAFRDRHGQIAARRGATAEGYKYKFDAVRFSHKSFAIVHAAAHCETRWMAWVDADTVTKRPVPVDLVASLLEPGAFVAYFGRSGNHTETGFVAYDLAHAGAREFFETIRRIYVSDEVFRLREWHDCEVFDVARTVLAAQGKITSRNLSPKGQTAHPIVNSPLGEFIDHLKGPIRKKEGASPRSDYKFFRGRRLPPRPANLELGRYAYVPKLIDALRPRSIVEIGTWSGHRALQMAEAALRHSPSLEYFGFDLFEGATADDDAREMNNKPHFGFDEVDALLARFAEEHPGFEYWLTKGDTKEVLPELALDFAFIDGGHSVETIRSDFERLKNCRVVLFDDYYEGGIDTQRFGCNEVVRELPHLVLPAGDPVKGGGVTRFVVVAQPELLETIRTRLGVAAPARVAG